MSTRTRYYSQAFVHFPYWKQGDDLASCIVNFPGTHDIDTRGTLTKYIEHFQMVIEMARELRDSIPLERERDFSIDGNTHCIYLSGPTSILQELQERKLVQIEENEESNNDSEEDTNDDNSDIDTDNDITDNESVNDRQNGEQVSHDNKQLQDHNYQRGEQQG